METGTVLNLPPQEAHHVFNVLRARGGDVIEAVDSSQRLFLAELLEGQRAAVREEISAPGAGGVGVVLYQAVPKGKHMDLVVEKAVEVGGDLIVPLIAERGVVRLDGGTAKVERWRRISESAARQSLRLRIPEVAEPTTFPEAARNVGSDGVLLHQREGLPRLEEVVGGGKSVALFIGPEGGWSEDEVELAEAVGLKAARLGPYRLRSETAGIVAVARARAALEALEARVEHT